MQRVATIAAAMLLAVTAGPAQARWITSWTAAPVNPSPAMGPFPATPAFNDRTFRQTVRLSAGGRGLRIRFTNAYGKMPLTIGAARVALLDDRGGEVAGSSRTLHFAGSTKAVAAVAAPIVSDRIALDVGPLSRLSVSLYLPGETGPCTCHATGLDQTDISAPGDHSAAPFAPASTSGARAFLSAVEVDAADDARTIVVLGDSISDGVGSTSGANRRWPDLLAERLARRGGAAWGVANQGISGNRVLQDGMGESALARLDRDVLGVAGAKAVILFEGVNDLGIAFTPAATGAQAAPPMPLPSRAIDADEIIAGYRQIIDRAHAQGLKVYGATIAPYKGAAYWSPAGEAARQKINAFIRTGGLFDAALDFDRVFADPADPAAIRADFHMGDHLHGNDRSYRAVAESIDLALFDK